MILIDIIIIVIFMIIVNMIVMSGQEEMFGSSADSAQKLPSAVQCAGKQNEDA